MRIADMETDKARNMVEYEEDIKSRPKKSWFQTNQEKREVRERNPASGRALEGGGSKRKAEEDEEDEEESAAPQISKKKVLTGKKEDKYAGMSRAKRRRVQMQEMDELEAARDKAPPPPAPARLTLPPRPLLQPPYRPALFSCRRSRATPRWARTCLRRRRGRGASRRSRFRRRPQRCERVRPLRRPRRTGPACAYALGAPASVLQTARAGLRCLEAVV
jgi:hypothetical protein